jgi:hypothetical protein
MSSPDAGRALMNLLHSARVVPLEAIPPAVVTMNSTVVLEDRATGKRKASVVYATDADPAELKKVDTPKKSGPATRSDTTQSAGHSFLKLSKAMNVSTHASSLSLLVQRANIARDHLRKSDETPEKYPVEPNHSKSFIVGQQRIRRGVRRR